jgi:hypothetical protein
MTFTTWPTRLVLEECDNVCLFALSAIAPAAQALCRDTAEEEDYVNSLPTSVAQMPIGPLFFG